MRIQQPAILCGPAAFGQEKAAARLHFRPLSADLRISAAAVALLEGLQ